MLKSIPSKTTAYDSPRTNQGPMRRTLARVGKSCQKTVSQTDAIDGPLVNQGDFDATVDCNLYKILEGSFCIVFEQEDGCASRKDTVAVD